MMAISTIFARVESNKQRRMNEGKATVRDSEWNIAKKMYADRDEGKMEEFRIKAPHTHSLSFLYFRLFWGEINDFRSDFFIQHHHHNQHHTATTTS